MHPEDRKRFLEGLKLAVRAAMAAHGQRVDALTVGPTGAGKSTLITALAGGTIIPVAVDPNNTKPISQLRERQIKYIQDPKETEIARIGANSARSETVMPQVVFSHELINVDVPGFLDTGGELAKLLSSLSVRLALQDASQGISTLVVTIPYEVLTLGKSGSLFPILLELRVLIKNLSVFFPARTKKEHTTPSPIIFAVTKIPSGENKESIKEVINNLLEDLKSSEAYQRKDHSTPEDQAESAEIRAQIEALQMLSHEGSIFPIKLNDGGESVKNVLGHLKQRQGSVISTEAFNLKQTGNKEAKILEFLNEFIQEEVDVDGNKKTKTALLRDYLTLQERVIELRRSSLRLNRDIQVRQEELLTTDLQALLAQIIANRPGQISEREQQIVQATATLAELRKRKDNLDTEYADLTSQVLVAGWSDSVFEERNWLGCWTWGYTRKEFFYNDVLKIPFDEVRTTCNSGKVGEGKFLTPTENVDKKTYKVTYESEYRCTGDAKIEILFKKNKLSANKTRATAIEAELPALVEQIDEQVALLARLEQEKIEFETELNNALQGVSSEAQKQGQLQSLRIELVAVIQDITSVKHSLAAHHHIVESIRDEFEVVFHIKNFINTDSSGLLKNFIGLLKDSQRRQPVEVNALFAEDNLPVCVDEIQAPSVVEPLEAAQKNSEDDAVANQGVADVQDDDLDIVLVEVLEAQDVQESNSGLIARVTNTVVGFFGGALGPDNHHNKHPSP